MNAAARLSLYAVGVLVAFGGAFSLAAAVVPKGAVNDWKEQASMQDHGSMAESFAGETPGGLSLSAQGYTLSPIVAPTKVGQKGDLSFRILDSSGKPLRAFAQSHEKDLHLISVRADGTHFVHMHPTLHASSGTWSLPWEWSAAGSYRVYADFVPDVANGPDKLTLTRTAHVAGDFTPSESTATKTTDSVDGFDLTVDGNMVAGKASNLTVTVFREGEPVTALQPYLGAFGHLVALRDGDLAYLHVHASGDDPKPGQTAGPTIAFGAKAPTPGRYLLYLDFQVDGTVHTAEFALDAAGTGTGDSGSHGH